MVILLKSTGMIDIFIIVNQLLVKTSISINKYIANVQLKSSTYYKSVKINIVFTVLSLLSLVQFIYLIYLKLKTVVMMLFWNKLQ